MHERQRELTDALRLALHSADEDGVSAIAMELGVPEHGADEACPEFGTWLLGALEEVAGSAVDLASPVSHRLYIELRPDWASLGTLARSRVLPQLVESVGLHSDWRSDMLIAEMIGEFVSPEAAMDLCRRIEQRGQTHPCVIPALLVSALGNCSEAAAKKIEGHLQALSESSDLGTSREAADALVTARRLMKRAGV